MKGGDPDLASVEIAFGYLMSWEIDTNDPCKVTTDAGGRTAWGIAEQYWPALWKNGPPSMQDAYFLFRSEFWSPLNCKNLNSQRVATKFSCHAYNLGVNPATSTFQEAINLARPGAAPIPVDGDFGPVSLEKANGLSATVTREMLLLSCYIKTLEAHYRKIVSDNPGQASKLDGWLRRATDLP